MTKLLAGNMGISSKCRFRLTNILCSYCDGDIVILIVIFRVRASRKGYVVNIVSSCMRIVKMTIFHLTIIIRLRYVRKMILFVRNWNILSIRIANQRYVKCWISKWR